MSSTARGMERACHVAYKTDPDSNNSDPTTCNIGNDVLPAEMNSSTVTNAVNEKQHISVGDRDRQQQQQQAKTTSANRKQVGGGLRIPSSRTSSAADGGKNHPPGISSDFSESAVNNDVSLSSIFDKFRLFNAPKVKGDAGGKSQLSTNNMATGHASFSGSSHQSALPVVATSPVSQAPTSRSPSIRHQSTPTSLSTSARNKSTSGVPIDSASSTNTGHVIPKCSAPSSVNSTPTSLRRSTSAGSSSSSVARAANRSASRIGRPSAPASPVVPTNSSSISVTSSQSPASTPRRSAPTSQPPPPRQPSLLLHELTGPGDVVAVQIRPTVRSPVPASRSTKPSLALQLPPPPALFNDKPEQSIISERTAWEDDAVDDVINTPIRCDDDWLNHFDDVMSSSSSTLNGVGDSTPTPAEIDVVTLTSGFFYDSEDPALLPLVDAVEELRRFAAETVGAPPRTAVSQNDVATPTGSGPSQRSPNLRYPASCASKVSQLKTTTTTKSLGAGVHVAAATTEVKPEAVSTAQISGEAAAEPVSDPRHDFTKPGIGFKRNALERQSIGSRRLPGKPEVKVDNQQTSIAPTGAACSNSDSVQRFERGVAARSSLPIVRTTSASSPSSTTSGRKFEPTPFQRTSSSRCGQPPTQLSISGREKRSALPVDGGLVAAVATTAAMSASATVRNLHPVGAIGGTSPATSRTAVSASSSGQRKALQISGSLSNGKKSSSSSPSGGASSRAIAANTSVNMQMKGERLSNYDKRSAASPPTSARLTNGSMISVPLSGATVANGNVEQSALPALSNNFVLHSSFAPDCTKVNRSVRSPIPPQLSSSAVTSSPQDSPRCGFGVSVLAANGNISDASEDGTLRRHTPDHRGSVDGTVISNPAAMMTPSCNNSRLGNSSRLKQLRSPVGLPSNNNDSNSSSSSPIRSPVGVCTPLRSSSVSSGSGRRLMMKPTATETDVEDYAERLGEGKRQAFGDGAGGGGPDWFGSARYPGNLSRSASASLAAAVTRSGMASPTISPASPTLAARSAWSPTTSPKHSPLQVAPTSNPFSERPSDCNASGGLLVSRPSVSCRTGLVSRLPLNSVTEEDNVNGSLLSLGSSSSVQSTAEEMQVHEIRKLRTELNTARAKIASLTSHLATNAHVVSAFEQSLTNMTQRLQRLAMSTDRKDAELNELRATIELLRQQSYHCRPMSAELDFRQLAASPTAEQLLQIGRQVSYDSIESESSATSQQSSLTTPVASTPERKMKKPKSWLNAFGKVLRRKKKPNEPDVVDNDGISETSSMSLTMSVPAQLCSVAHMPSQSFMKVSNSDAKIRSGCNAEDEAVVALQQQLQEKDSRLTDIQLEALTSAHRLQQMRDVMIKMKAEISSLRSDNERLHSIVSHKASSPQPDDDGKNENQQQQPSSLPCVNRLDDPASSLDFLMAGAAYNVHEKRLIKLYVQLNQLMSSTTSEAAGANRTLIGQLSLSNKTNWESLDEIIGAHFKEYLLKIDPDASLGLTDDSIFSYSIGSEVTRRKGVEKPELLPCGYIIGDTNSITINLKGAKEQSVDLLAFDVLIPKSIVERYVSLLMEHCRVILCGSTGTGKSFLARKLAEHLIRRSGREPDSNNLVTFNVDSQSGRELRKYLSNIAERCSQQKVENPIVIILDSLHHLTLPLTDVFSGLLNNVDMQTSPYIIGTMTQSTSCSSTNLQLHHNFRWILGANHIEPVLGFLGRYLRRQKAAAEILSVDGSNLDEIVEWLPRLWRHVNRLIETHSSAEMTIGPRLFLSCPMDVNLIPVWFTDLWNYSIVPYMLEVMRDGIQTSGVRSVWEDPTEWVLSTCPWKNRDASNLSSLISIRPQDVGYDCQLNASSLDSALPSSPPAISRAPPPDPLMNMLMRLQEAADYGNGQSAGTL